MLAGGVSAGSSAGPVSAASDAVTIDLLSKHDPTLAEGNLVLSAGVCPKCRELSPIVVKLEQVTTNAKGQITRKKLEHLTYPGDALPAFEALYSYKPPSEKDD